MIDDGSCVERLYGSMGNEEFISEEMSDLMLKHLIRSILKNNSVTQDELSKHSIDEEDVEKYGLSTLLPVGIRNALNRCRLLFLWVTDHCRGDW